MRMVLAYLGTILVSLLLVLLIAHSPATLPGTLLQI